MKYTKEQVLKYAKEKVIDCLSNLLSLDRKESLYLEEFSKGNYDPSLLFDDSVVIRAEKHPMAKWRALNIIKQINNTYHSH